MRLLLAVCFLSAACACARNAPLDLQIESKVPSMAISFAGQENSFAVTNGTAHNQPPVVSAPAVTAPAVTTSRNVPALLAVPRPPDQLVCGYVLHRLGEDGSQPQRTEQSAAGLSEKQWKMVQRMARDYIQAIKEFRAKQQALVAARRAQTPPGQMSGPLPAEMRQLADQGNAVFNSHLVQLKSQLGESFPKFDVYAHESFEAGMAATQFIRLYSLFLWRLAKDNPAQDPAKVEAPAKERVARVALDQQAAGFSDKEWALVKRAADDYNRSAREIAAKTLAAMDAFGGGQHLGQMLSTQPPFPSSVPVVPIDHRPELGQLIEEEKQLTSSQVAQLRPSLGEASFKKLDDYVHTLPRFPFGPFGPGAIPAAKQPKPPGTTSSDPLVP